MQYQTIEEMGEALQKQRKKRRKENLEFYAIVITMIGFTIWAVI